MPYPILVAFYFELTEKRGFKKFAQRLGKRCNKLGLKCIVVQRNLRGYIKELRTTLTEPRDVRLVYRCQPAFIQEMLTKLQVPILYLHCDSRIVRAPDKTLFPDNMCVGYQVEGAPRRKGKKDEILAAPLYFKPSDTAFTFLELWKMKCENINTEETEHRFLNTTVLDFKYDMSVIPFPGNLASRDEVTGAAICSLAKEGRKKKL